MEILQEAPKSDAFIPLSEHQSATPASFYLGPPVLHYHSNRCKVRVAESELNSSPALAAFARGASDTPAPTDGLANGGGSLANGHAESTLEKIVEDVEIWVASDKLYLFCTPNSSGVSIPYPTISLHAIQTLPGPTAGEQQSLYMQLISPEHESEEDGEPDSISITIIPPLERETQSPTTEGELQTDDAAQTPTAVLFTALSNCSNLHPDPVDRGASDEADLQDSALYQAGMIMPGSSSGGLPAPLPGSGGWITAENISEYFDGEGNWIGGEQEREGEALGPGAGRVRLRDDGEAREEGSESDETKWQRRA